MSCQMGVVYCMGSSSRCLQRWDLSQVVGGVLSFPQGLISCCTWRSIRRIDCGMRERGRGRLACRDGRRRRGGYLEVVEGLEVLESCLVLRMLFGKLL